MKNSLKEVANELNENFILGFGSSILGLKSCYTTMHWVQWKTIVKVHSNLRFTKC